MEKYSLAISALQHFAYCPRQFALIHLEQVWSENFHTAHGRIIHERVDSAEPEQRGNTRFERSVSVHHDELAIHGKLDLLEIVTEQAQDIESVAKPVFIPVEYKRGKHKIENWDRIQLCAQALCIETMQNVSIDEGALWYWQERKRELVPISAALRNETIEAINKAHEIIRSQLTPKPTAHKMRCKACSLIDLCEPRVFRQDNSTDYVAGLFNSVNSAE